MSIPRGRSIRFLVPPPAVVAIAIGAATLALFSRSFDSGFINFDDGPYVTSNPHVLAGASWADFLWAFRTMDCANWHPLTWLSLQVDATLFGAGPVGFHFTNALLHAVNTALLFLLLTRATSRPWPSVIAALIFGWHPLRVESVAWVAERKDVLSAFFFFLTLLAYLGYVRSTSAWRYLAVFVLFAAGLAAKPMLVTLPAVLLLLDYWPLGRFSSRRFPRWFLVVEKLPFIGLSVGSSVLTIVAQRSGGAVATLAHIPPATRLANAGIAYVDYLGVMIWPMSLAPLYPLGDVDWARALAAWTLIGAITGAVIIARRSRPYWLVGWLWYAGMLMPVIGLVQVGLQSRADRYTYLPMIGILAAVIWTIADLARYRLPAAAAAMTIAGILPWLAAQTWRQQAYWSDSQMLWTHDIQVAPGHFMAEYNLAAALQASDLRQAKTHYENAARLEPSFPDAEINLGSVLLSLGDATAAIPHCERAIQLRSDLAGPFQNLGMAWMRLGNFDKAASAFQQASQRAPADAELRDSLGLAYYVAGNFSAALQEFSAAALLEPANAKYVCDVAHALWRLDRRPDARLAYEHASKLQPDWPAKAATEANALVSATPGNRDPAGALFLAEMLCEASDFRQPRYLVILASARATNADFRGACDAMQRALAVPAKVSPEEKSAWSKLLEHYQNLSPR